ncbi:Crossover junction endodeoxyribonuclease RuvC [Anaerolineae bacterium]|nr:Crossover junction endodeoxyribonuclease RuvC [Anaerolineae bacterium]
MRVLGIDPGSINTGYGIVGKGAGGSLVKICAGAISPGASLPVAERLLRVSEGLSRVIEEHRPDAVSIETVFFAKNVKSAITLGQARGAALVCAARSALPVFEYAPAAVKLAVTGYGQAEKAQVEKMVRLLLKSTEDHGKADAFDALAIAICHIHSCPEASRLRAPQAPLRPR